jgi:hypothetical protein
LEPCSHCIAKFGVNKLGKKLITDDFYAKVGNTSGICCTEEYAENIAASD